MSKNFKKILLIFSTLFLITFIFIGCDNVKLSTDVKINSDGSTNSKLSISYDETVSNLVDNDLFNKLLGDDAYNYSIHKYKNGDLFVEEIEFSTDKIDLKSLSSNSALLAFDTIENDFSKLFNYDVSRKKGFLKDTYTLKVHLNHNILNLINSSMKDGLDDTLNKYMGSNFSGFFSSGISDTVTKQISTVPYDLTVSTPIDIVDSNATVQSDSRHLMWNYTLGELNENTELCMSFMLPNFVNIAIIVVVVLILIICIVIFIRRSKNS